MKRRWIALTGVLTGMGSSAVMQTYLSVSMPSIADELGGMSLYNWVFGAYMLASTVTLPLFGKLADKLGRRKLYLTGLFLFTAGVAFCGLSVSMPMLVFSRILMGAGAGAVTPAALGMMGDLFDEKDFAKVFGLMGLVQVLSNLTGPLLGAYLSAALSWRWGFMVFLPLELSCAVLICLGPAPAAPEGLVSNNPPAFKTIFGKLDWKGALLISVGLVGVILGLQFVSWEEAALGICLVMLSVSVLWFSFRLEKACTDPVLPITLLHNPVIRNGVIAVFLLGIIHYSTSAYLSLYYQSVLGKSVKTAGMLLLPMLISAGAAGALCGKIPKHARYTVSLLLWILTGLSFAGIALLGSLFEGLAAVLFSIPLGLASGFLLPLYLGSSQTQADESNRAVSGGMVQLSRNLGGTLGVSLLGILISGPLPVKTGLNGIFLCLAAVGLSAFVFSILRNKSVGLSNKA